MTRPYEGDHAGRDRLHTVLRGTSMTVGVACGVIAVWLIVTADTQKGTRVGALVGFWALLLAAYGVFGTHRPVMFAQPGHALDIRPHAELDRVEDVAARREYEYRLAEMLRREVQATMGAELATLRADVAALRSELVEKVGGQLRMERIETTRVIGSDIEALQHEVRQLMVSRQPHDVGSFSLGTTHTALIAGVAEQPTLVQAARPVAAEAVSSQPEAVTPQPEAVTPQPEPVAPPPEPFAPIPGPPIPGPPIPGPPIPGPPIPGPPIPGPPKPGPPAPLPPAPQPPAPPEPITPEPVHPEPMPPVPSVAAPAAKADPFASMPRLRPFTDFELDPIETGPAHDPYAGRRRTDDAAGTSAAAGGAGNGGAGNGVDEHTAPGSGRHANSSGDVHVDSKVGGGRRRRAANEGDDVLARILQREGAR